MKIEISHDTLAKRVYDKASTEDRMRLRVSNFIKAKHHFFEQERVYLTPEELKFIAPFENQIELVDAEKVFIARSKWLARKQFIFFGVGVLIIFAVLLWFLFYYRSSNKIIERVNAELIIEKKGLTHAKDSIEQLVNTLLLQDSIQDDLRTKIQDKDSTISMTKTELQRALHELQVVNKELEIAYKKLEEHKKQLERDCDKLKIDNRNLTLKLKEQGRNTTTSSTLEQSQKLSQLARVALGKNDKPTEKQYEEAFLLARAAWEMNNKNSQAMDILSEIGNVKLNSNNGGFLNNTRPKYTYTYKQIELIINNLDKKYNYGTLSPYELKLRLK